MLKREKIIVIVFFILYIYSDSAIAQDKYLQYPDSLPELKHQVVNRYFYIRNEGYGVYGILFHPDTTTVHKKWKCIDVVIDTPTISLVKFVLENEGRSIKVTRSRLISDDTAQRLIEEYGISDFNKILEGRVEGKWTEQEVIWSIGEPTKKDSSHGTMHFIYGDYDDIPTYYDFDSKGHLRSIMRD